MWPSQVQNCAPNQNVHLNGQCEGFTRMGSPASGPENVLGSLSGMSTTSGRWGIESCLCQLLFELPGQDLCFWWWSFHPKEPSPLWRHYFFWVQNLVSLNKACGSHWMRMDGYYLLPLKLHLCLLDEDYPVLWIFPSANKWSKQPCGATVQAPQTLASKWITLIDKWILNMSLWQHWTHSERGNCWVPHAPLVHSNATRGWKTPTWGTVGIPLTLSSLSYLFNHTVFTDVKLCKNSTELLHLQKE